MQARLDAQRAPDRRRGARTSSPSTATPAARWPRSPRRAGVASGTRLQPLPGKAELVAEVFRTVVRPRGRRGARRPSPPRAAPAARHRAVVETFAAPRAEVAAAGLRAARRAGRPGRRRAAAASSARRSATSSPARSTRGVARRRTARRRTPPSSPPPWSARSARRSSARSPAAADDPPTVPDASSRFALRSLGAPRCRDHPRGHQPGPAADRHDIADHPALLEGLHREGAGWAEAEVRELGAARQQRRGAGVGPAGQRAPAGAAHPRPLRQPRRRGRVPARSTTS